MGGHTAWRKRVANGELAKGLGGAIMRHRPRWGPKGKEALARQRRGYDNPKKRGKKNQQTKNENDSETITPYFPVRGKPFIFVLLLGLLVFVIRPIMRFQIAERVKG